ncbi:MAG: hypothetical protein ABEH78_02750 [Haloferacaceae archaeon]
MRVRPAVLASVLLLAAVGGGVGADAGVAVSAPSDVDVRDPAAGGVRTPDAGTVRAPSDGDLRPAGDGSVRATDGRSIRMSVEATLRDGGASVTVAYRLPDSVTGLRVTLPVAAADASRVTASRGFRRLNATTFEWTGVADPRIELALSDDARRVLAGDGWALVVEPDATTSYSYRGSAPGFESSFGAAGQGYTAGSIAYLGPYRTVSVVAGGERTTFVVAGAADPVDVSGAASFLRLAPGRFDFGIRRDATTAFVLPERHDPTAGSRVVGAAVESSLWVHPSAVRPGTNDVTFVHEYVHTRLGIVGRGSARWLTEATAEYFGHAFALNAGIGGYEAFRRGLDPTRFGTDPGTVVLADPATWAGTAADYGKGATVLAALDAEIRRRTDGQYTLADVFAARPGPYADHAAFRRAVVEVTGVPSLATWIDRYASTDATPALPDEPSRFVYGPTLDPDGDGVTSGRERTRGTNPFVAARPTATPTPTATSTPTPTATPERTGTTAGGAGGFGAPGAAAALGLAALVAVLAARRRR